MKHFVKLNVISVMFATIFVLIVEYLLNAYRIQEYIGFDNTAKERMVSGMFWAVIVILTCACCVLTHFWMRTRPSVFWSMLLWFPYAILIIRLIAVLGPERHPAESSYAVGLIILMLMIAYPFIIGLTVLIGIAWPSRNPADDRGAKIQE